MYLHIQNDINDINFTLLKSMKKLFKNKILVGVSMNILLCFFITFPIIY